MFLFDPFKYQFFTNGLLAATLVGALTGLIGVFVVLRRMSYIGHGLSHSVFGGAVISYVIQLNFYIGAGLWGFFSALLIGSLARKHKVSADAAIGIVTTASFAIGVALISKVRTFTRNFEAALFGNILGVTSNDVLIIGLVTLVIGLVIFFTYKQMLFMTFDPEVAQVFGVKVRWYDTLFSLLLATTIIVSIQILGVTLIAATLVIPASIARLVTNSFGKTLIISTIMGALCGFIGMYSSFYIDVASGATIVLVATLFFAITAYLFSGSKNFAHEHVH